ncbi:hypothetical protein PSW73_23385, partial [Shigella flexneri]|nr:hypothetical protein [Shigella flexneri]
LDFLLRPGCSSSVWLMALVSLFSAISQTLEEQPVLNSVWLMALKRLTSAISQTLEEQPVLNRKSGPGRVQNDYSLPGSPPER